MFFFFQAEDGIRDIGVTGVQTCALPIWMDSAHNLNMKEAGPAASDKSIKHAIRLCRLGD